ncbi:enolase C-terminal domain-like protein [Chitinophaga sp. MM2321]|uniref:enolase C-terminal domain-like protein n=1 Tax=Chitinophaga sp. MM2321 TaxID=3137178 RepID=UPI0032D56C4F
MHKIDEEIFNITKAYIRILKPAKAVTPFEDATMGPFHSFGIAMLSLEDENGFTGEAPVFHSYNNIFENCLLPILFHNNNASYETMYYRLYWSIRNEGFRGQAAALIGQIDIALHDLAAKRKGLPLHQYLNASRNLVRVYGSGGGTNYSLKELEAEVVFFLSAGVDCYKMKVGKYFGTRMKEDVDRVKFVRNLLGKDVRLAVDANQIWNCEQARKFIDLTGNENLAWFEEPIHSASLDQIAQLCKSTTSKIAYGESERSALVFPALVNAGVRHLQPVPTQINGVNEWMQVRDLAAKEGIEFSSGGYSWVTAPFIASATEDCQVEYLYSLMAGLEKYFSVYPKLKNGMFELSDVEGLSVRVDWDYCQKKELIAGFQSWESDQVAQYRPIVNM